MKGVLRMKRSMKAGFTLAEVLITLAVIGVVAAMSIPALIGSTNQQEFKVGLKKAVAVVNQAITMSIALDAEDASGKTVGSQMANYFKNRLNVIGTGPVAGQSFYTADGMLFDFSSSGSCSKTEYNCQVKVDVNGAKGPNVLSVDTAPTTYKDQYYIMITDQNALPYGAVAQNAMTY